MAGSPVAGAGTGGVAGEASGGGGAGMAGAGAGGAPVCGACPAEVTVPLWEEPTTEKAGGVDVEFCTLGADDAATPPECIVRVEVGKASLTSKVSAGLVTFSGFVPVHLPASHHKVMLGTFPNIGTVAPVVAASVGKGQGDDCSSPTPTVAQVSWVAPLLTDDPAPAFGCADVGESVKFTLTIPDGDAHLCGKCDVPLACGIWDGVIGEVDKRVRQRVTDAVRAALDDVAKDKACALAPAVGLTFGGVAIRDRDQQVSLTDMWKAAGSNPARKPTHWLRSEAAHNFIAFVAQNERVAESQLVVVVRGDGGCTWAHWQVAMAYAKYLSPEFHAWCNSVVREHMEARGARRLP